LLPDFSAAKASFDADVIDTSSFKPTGDQPMSNHRAVFVALASAVLALSGSGAAFAHAQLSKAMPAAGGAVPMPPSEVTLNFTEKLEATFSTVIVRDAVGKRVNKADAQVDKADRTVMRVGLDPLMPGIYIVEWRALTADTHKTEGAFIFRVGE
jgi:methionine-rich copper-binding protein CopC